MKDVISLHNNLVALAFRSADAAIGTTSLSSISGMRGNDGAYLSSRLAVIQHVLYPCDGDFHFWGSSKLQPFSQDTCILTQPASHNSECKALELCGLSK
jgi:hypothetical protein